MGTTRCSQSVHSVILHTLIIFTCFFNCVTSLESLPFFLASLSSSSSISKLTKLSNRSENWLTEVEDIYNNVYPAKQDIVRQLQKRAAGDFVSTNYWIDSTIYYKNNSVIPWNAVYTDKTTSNYTSLAQQYCNLLIGYLQRGPLTANKQKACISVTFSPRQLTIIYEKRQAGSPTTSESIVSGNATIQMNTTANDTLSADAFTDNFVTAYNTTNVTSTIQLFDVQVGKEPITITTESTTTKTVTTLSSTGTATATSAVTITAQTPGIETAMANTTPSSFDTTPTGTYDGFPTYSFVEFSLATRPATSIMPVILPSASTTFNVRSKIYHQSNDTPIPWSDEYTNTNSQSYNDLKSKYCDLLLGYLRQSGNSATDGASCNTTTFTPVNAIQPDGSIRRIVEGDTSIIVPTTAGSQLTGSQLNSILIQGYNQTSIPSSIKLNTLETQRATGTLTCAQITKPCGDHATCRDAPPGISCFCNSMWRDMNPRDPGKQCALHPAAIALIALAALLLLAALILLIICLLRRRQRRRGSILASTDLAAMKSWRQKRQWKLNSKGVNELPQDLNAYPTDTSISPEDMVIPRASVGGLPSGTIGLPQIPASPVAAGMVMPPAVIGSNYVGSPQQFPTTTYQPSGIGMPTAPIAGIMGSGLTGGLSQIPASPLASGMVMPPAAVGSNYVANPSQLRTAPYQPSGMGMPTAPVAGITGSGLTGGLSQIPASPVATKPLSMPPVTVEPNYPNNVPRSLQKIPASSVPASVMPVSVSSKGNMMPLDVVSGSAQMPSSSYTQSGLQMPSGTLDSNLPSNVPKGLSQIPPSPSVNTLQRGNIFNFETNMPTNLNNATIERPPQ
ncbi:unnamed protein product [Heterobilharzia americana]|nr:unnamed protein product [Heterobilharzia americana]CAH8576803.1 unnamed protein product [Heterobilharzia americana]